MIDMLQKTTEQMEAASLDNLTPKAIVAALDEQNTSSARKTPSVQSLLRCAIAGGVSGLAQTFAMR